MAQTFMDLASDSLTEVGSLGVGEVIDPESAFLCMRTFNELIYEWSTDRTLIFTVGNAQYNLSANKQSYQIGPGAADFNTNRPVLIQSAAVIINGTTARRPVDLMSSQQWAALGEKGLTGVFPDKLYCGFEVPIATLNVHPVPSSPIVLELYTFSVMQTIVNLTDLLTFPPGYYNALKYILAVKICSSFGMPLQQMTVQQAVAGKAAIQQINLNLYRGALGTSSTFPLPTEGAPAAPAIAGPQQ